MRILIVGVTGMLGNAVFRYLDSMQRFEVFGSARSASARKSFDARLGGQIIDGIDVENQDAVFRLFERVKPDVVVNCVGLIKQLAEADDPLSAIPINALLPHRLSALCAVAGARFIHVSTDCVFSGEAGMYRESDVSDARDLYGRSKYLGEVSNPHSITLRTSIIGPELNGGAHALLGWFLAQQGRTNGYTKAIFSGLPTVELARVIGEVVIPRPDLHGLYHVSAEPIAKFDLLSLIAEVYGKQIEILPVDKPVIDRSLNSERFTAATGYVAPGWRELVVRMFNFK